MDYKTMTDELYNKLVYEIIDSTSTSLPVNKAVPNYTVPTYSYTSFEKFDSKKLMLDKIKKRNI